jgi:hypothetical protein
MNGAAAIQPTPMTTPRVPETRKRPGVFYAVTEDGLELPIVDVTHPAFASAVTDEEERALVDRFLKEPQPLRRLPAPVRKRLLKLLFRGTVLGRHFAAADGSFLSGIATYLLKLGPDNLGVYANRVDRRIAAAFPAATMRWRLRDIARLLADALAPMLVAGDTSPVHLVNIAGGPALDSLNALLLLEREQPAALRGRTFVLNVLDGDDGGPTFGARALAAWRAKGGPLQEVDVVFRHVRYDWRRAQDLTAVLDAARADQARGVRGARVAGSSEGGLFEYGSDEEIVENLRALRQGAPEDVAMVGSVTRADAPVQRLRQMGAPAIRPRGLAAFRELARAGGFDVVRVIERPFSDHVVLGRAG